MIILFPSEPFSPKEVDSSFKAEYEAAKLVGFETFLFDHDEMAITGNLKTNLPYNNGGKLEKIILRGWMLKGEYYGCLSVGLIERGYELINGVKEYLNCHYFTNAFPIIKDYTSKAWWTEEWFKMKDTHKTEWKSIRDYLNGDVIIKDYVKSEKGTPDLFILKKELTNKEFYEHILRFIDARGKLFNVGLVFKEVMDLKKYDGKTNEWRIFFLNNEPINFGFNSEILFSTNQPSLGTLNKFYQLGKTIESNFFTMDIAEKENGDWMILELGDGQVSGLAMAEDAIKFYNTMYNKLNAIEV